MTGSYDVNRAIDYVLEEFDEHVADAERSHGGDEFSVCIPRRGSSTQYMSTNCANSDLR